MLDDPELQDMASTARLALKLARRPGVPYFTKKTAGSGPPRKSPRILPKISPRTPPPALRI